MPTLARLDLERTVVLPSVARAAACTDGELEALQREIAGVERLAHSRAALVAAEVARRSAPELGHAGLAQRSGARTPERLIERWAGVSPDDARAMVQVGELMSRDEPVAKVIATSVARGEISILAAAAIQSGLGESTATVTETALIDAAAFMVSVAPDLPVRRVSAESRALRDALDSAGAAGREEQLKERRYLRLTPQSDGMTKVLGLLDPESAAIVGAAFDEITSPRRGGPRFVDPEAAARSRAIIDDPRTTDQLVCDAFVELVRIATAADDGTVFAQRKPAVQIHVALTDLESGEGFADFQGQTAPVSVATAQRLACSIGEIPILFDGGDPIDVGRAQRLFTVRQRVALAARDGGCLFPGCDRPPSWCEAHHIDEWKRDNGRTDVSRGVLLCRHHHQWIHVNHWRITRSNGQFVAVPPAGSTTPEMPMPSRSPVSSRARHRIALHTRATG
ncbi:hypothetical protein BH11ACT3_BH11ACT3_08640 [soil metagenome]